MKRLARYLSEAIKEYQAGHFKNITCMLSGDDVGYEWNCDLHLVHNKTGDILAKSPAPPSVGGAVVWHYSDKLMKKFSPSQLDQFHSMDVQSKQDMIDRIMGDHDSLNSK